MRINNIDILNIEINIAYGAESFLPSHMKITSLFVLALVEFKGRFLCERKII